MRGEAWHAAERTLALPLKQVDQHGDGHKRDRNYRESEKRDEGELKGDDHRKNPTRL